MRWVDACSEGSSHRAPFFTLTLRRADKNEKRMFQFTFQQQSRHSARDWVQSSRFAWRFFPLRLRLLSLAARSLSALTPHVCARVLSSSENALFRSPLTSTADNELRINSMQRTSTKNRKILFKCDAAPHLSSGRACVRLGLADFSPPSAPSRRTTATAESHQAAIINVNIENKDSHSFELVFPSFGYYYCCYCSQLFAFVLFTAHRSRITI